MAREDGFFDDLARGLADGTLTRGKALRLMGAAVVGERWGRWVSALRLQPTLPVASATASTAQGTSSAAAETAPAEAAGRRDHYHHDEHHEHHHYDSHDLDDFDEHDLDYARVPTERRSLHRGHSVLWRNRLRQQQVLHPE